MELLGCSNKPCDCHSRAMYLQAEGSGGQLCLLPWEATVVDSFQWSSLGDALLLVGVSPARWTTLCGFFRSSGTGEHVYGQLRRGWVTGFDLGLSSGFLEGKGWGSRMGHCNRTTAGGEGRPGSRQSGADSWSSESDRAAGLVSSP